LDVPRSLLEVLAKDTRNECSSAVLGGGGEHAALHEGRQP